jgi:uncharacterized delta-60 repeat protein
MAVQPDGKILLAGQAPQAIRVCRNTHKGRRCHQTDLHYGAVSRFNADGSLDTGFGAGGGIVDFRFARILGNLPAEFPAIALQPNGQIVVGADRGFRLARYTSDGRADANFGDYGIGGDWPSPSFAERAEETSPSALLVRGDGTIAVGGTLAGNFQAHIYWAEAAARLYNADGSFKEGLGEGPLSPPQVGSSLSDLIAEPDGSLIAAGSYSPDATPGLSAMLARFVPGSGVPHDPSFAGGEGFASFPPGSAAGAVIADAGKLVVAGSLESRLLLARFGEEGIADPGFGKGGFSDPVIPGSIAARATAVAVQPDGKLVVAGKTLDACQTEPLFGRCWNLLIGRFNSDGSVDTTFGQGGFARLATPNDPRFEPGDVDLAVLPDGKLLLSEGTGTGREVFVLARYDADGKLDQSFGDAGIATALPCQGSISQRRRSGCLGSAVVNLRFSGLATRRPHGSLSVVNRNPLDPIVAVQVLLPFPLRGRPASAKRVKVVTVRRHEAAVKVHPGSVVVNRMGLPRGLHIGLPPGILRAAREIPQGHKLIFRVEVRYRDGSTQAIRVKQEG